MPDGTRAAEHQTKLRVAGFSGGDSRDDAESPN